MILCVAVAPHGLSSGLLDDAYRQFTGGIGQRTTLITSSHCVRPFLSAYMKLLTRRLRTAEAICKQGCLTTCKRQIRINQTENTTRTCRHLVVRRLLFTLGTLYLHPMYERFGVEASQ